MFLKYKCIIVLDKSSSKRSKSLGDLQKDGDLVLTSSDTKGKLKSSQWPLLLKVSLTFFKPYDTYLQKCDT